MTGPGGEGRGEGRAPQDQLSDEARATASALLDWLGTRVGDLGDMTSPGMPASGRPSQSPGPCTWCPICALVAAFRGEQPELTSRLAEHATALMALLRLMVQAHQDPSHAHHHHHDADLGATAAGTATPPPPPGWPSEWGAWDGWGAGAADRAPEGSAPEDTAPRTEPDERPAEELPAEEPHADELRTDPTPPPSTRAHGRRVPIRRASPRSAAFRGTTSGAAPAGDADTPSPTSARRTAGAPRPGPRPAGGGPRPAPRRQGVAAGPTPAPTATPAPTPTAAPDLSAPPPPVDQATQAVTDARGPQGQAPRPTTGPPRPSVQRIAIRRPARPGRTAGTGEAGNGSADDTPC